jgi:hypothetical protein
MKQTKTILMSNKESCYNMCKHRLFCHFLSIFVSFFNKFSPIQNLYAYSSVHILTMAFLWCYRKERKINNCSKWGKSITKFSLLKGSNKSALSTILFIDWYNDIWVKNITTLYIYDVSSSPEKRCSVCKSAGIMQNSLAMTNIWFLLMNTPP